MTRRFDTLVIGDQDVKLLARNRWVPLAVMENDWGEFCSQRTYKVALRGVALIRIVEKCANRGALKTDSILYDRAFTCEVGGHRQDKDENAADNLEHFA